MFAHLFSLPISDPVLIFALAMAIFLVAPLMMERFKIPGLIGLIAAGALVGPNGLHLLERGPTIVLLGTVGLIYLMFLAGVEIDLHGFRRHRGRSVAFGVLTFLVPQLLGTAVAAAIGFGTASALLIGAMLASHTLLAYPLARRLGVAKNPAVVVAVGGTMIADTAALLVLALVAASTEGALDVAFWIRLGIGLSVFAVLVLVGLPVVARWFFRRETTGAPSTFVFVLAALFAGSVLAEMAGVEAIVGAFLVGLALNRLIPANGLLINRIHFVGDALLIPFFMLSVGMLFDVRVFLGNPRAWLVMGALLLVAVGGKWIAADVIGRVARFTAAERGTMFGLSVSRASATLAIALIGHDLGLFDDVVEDGAILIMLVTSFLGPWVVDRMGRDLARHEALKPYEPTEAPRRVLVPLSNPDTAPALMDLALLARDRRSAEPLYAVTVVPEEGENAAEYVANAERMLSHAVAYAAGADVQVLPMTRVDQNFASGILRGVVETRATTLVIGWDGRRSRNRIFGTVLDQLLANAGQLVVVAKLGHPLAITKRVFAVVPPGSDHAAGFYEAAGLIKRLAVRLHAKLEVIAVGADPDRCREEFEAPGPQVPLAVQSVPSWTAMMAALRAQLDTDDLTILLGARRDTVAWDPILRVLPARLARLRPESFLVVYPPEHQDVTLEPETEHWMPHALTRPRIVTDLEARSAHVALDRMLERQYPDEPARRREILRALLHAGRSTALPIAPGVVIPHARLDVLGEPLLFLGISRQGIRFPDIEQAAHVIFLVLSPTDQANQHLAVLGDIARLCANPDRVSDLRAARDIAAVLAVLEAMPGGETVG